MTLYLKQKKLIIYKTTFKLLRLILIKLYKITQFRKQNAQMSNNGMKLFGN